MKVTVKAACDLYLIKLSERIVQGALLTAMSIRTAKSRALFARQYSVSCCKPA